MNIKMLGDLMFTAATTVSSTLVGYLDLGDPVSTSQDQMEVFEDLDGDLN